MVGVIGKVFEGDLGFFEINPFFDRFKSLRRRYFESNPPFYFEFSCQMLGKRRRAEMVRCEVPT